MRPSKLEVLTVGKYAYTPNSRISALLPILSNVYRLRITAVKKR